MQTLTHDILINGAGPTGSALALMLAAKTGHPERIALAGPVSNTSAGPRRLSADPDPRTLALNHGSRTLLEGLAAWPQACADIRTVHVSQQGRLGRTVIDHADLSVPRLGSVVPYDALLSALHSRLRDVGVDIVATPCAVAAAGGHVVADTPTGRLTAAVAVQSHGRQPQGITRQYNQHAVLATVQASHPKPGWAYERFTRQGPLALLPHPQRDDTYAVVWCCPPDQADTLRNDSSSRFDHALNQHFGDRLGQLRSAGERHVFPLSLHAGPLLLNARTLAIGNAAQTLHPVAGQGLNLGLRDVAQLGITLAPWLANPTSDILPFMHEFIQRRRADRWLSAGITDALPRVFATGNPLVEHACGLALLGLDMLPAVRNTLARHLLQGLRI